MSKKTDFNTCLINMPSTTITITIKFSRQARKCCFENHLAKALSNFHTHTYTDDSKIMQNVKKALQRSLETCQIRNIKNCK